MNNTWETANMLNANSDMPDQLFMNSPGSIFSNDIVPNQIQRKIFAEFQFYDKAYWNNAAYCIIQLFYSGHGMKGNIPMGSGTSMEYK